MKRFFNYVTYNRILHFFGFQRSSSTKSMSSLGSLKFDNLALKSLPIDNVEENYVRTVKAACFSKVKPTPLNNPRLVAVSTNATSLLDIEENDTTRKEFVEYFSGNKLLPGSEPAAHCYCGHQFGYFAGQLGDGAAIYLGEVINKKNERWEIQLKGAGLTPYSRTADGRKVLRSSIREFLCSEAMHFLGVPTCRAGSCITSDTEVIRDIFYDGNNKAEKCSVVLRIAPTFIRFGSFEIFKTLDPVTGKFGPSVGRIEMLHTLLNYVIDTFYPEISESIENQTEKYKSFFEQVVLRTAKLVALWQCVGFCHGVLNTDNMSILGLTIDYGPYGFLDMYDPNHICNASDDGGRYTYIKQPEICLWNLQKLAEAIQQALPLEQSLPILELYQKEFDSQYLKKMQDKLGLLSRELTDDSILIHDLFDTMQNTGADFTNTFLCLEYIDANDLQSTIEIARERLLQQCYPLKTMIDAYNPKINPIQLQTMLNLASSNPELLDQLGKSGLYIKRILAQIQKLETLKTMTQETKQENDNKLWSVWLKKYQQRIETDFQFYKHDMECYCKERINIMKNNNPRFILRNYVLQEAIEKAEKEDFSQVQNLVKVIERPYESSYSDALLNKSSEKSEELNGSNSSAEVLTPCKEYPKAPDWSFSLKVT